MAAVILNHTETTSKSSTLFWDSSAYMRQNRPNVEYIISEFGSTIGGASGPDYQLSASLGGAIWCVDWMLYAMTLVKFL
jgi:hypothetical protein